MKHYDFILFENYILATHHLYDVKLIACMLKSQNIKVAIFDIFHQFVGMEVDGIDVIHWVPVCKRPDYDWVQRPHSKVQALFKSIRGKSQMRKYMREAKSFIEDAADNFYCGSYHNGMDTTFFKMRKPCYWWGLRSDRMKLSCRKLCKSPLLFFTIWRERKCFLENERQRLFVSNPIIKKEFEEIGIPANRMIIREERCMDAIGSPKLEAQSMNPSFLIIGMLRPEKHIVTSVKAFKRLSVSNVRLMLIGRSSSTEYEKKIQKAIDRNDYIIRENRYLEYADFNAAFISSHFVLFADEKGASCITNGTMMESLINYRPIICPNYAPYKYYIEKYGVGLLYEPGDIESYACAMKKALRLGSRHFLPAIEAFLLTIKFDRVSSLLVESIKNIENEKQA